MSDTGLDPTQAAAELRQQLARKRTGLDSTATFLTFEPGLYAIEFRAASGSMSDVGLALPCARLEPVPAPASPGRAFVSMMPEGGWLSRATAAAHVLVVGGRAGAVLTIYRPTDGTAMPEIHFRSVLAAAATPAPAPPPSQAALASGLEPVAPGASVVLLVHVEGQGDKAVEGASWAGDVSGQQSLEGFSLTLPSDMAPSDLEYQGIMGEDWRTPWFEAGAFCGSRGLQLPLLGFRLRLVGDAAERFSCQAYGQFARAGLVGPVASGKDCHADNQPLTAMRVEITRKGGEPVLPDAEPPAEAVKKPRWRRTKL